MACDQSLPSMVEHMHIMCIFSHHPAYSPLDLHPDPAMISRQATAFHWAFGGKWQQISWENPGRIFAPGFNTLGCIPVRQETHRTPSGVDRKHGNQKLKEPCCHAMYPSKWNSDWSWERLSTIVQLIFDFWTWDWHMRWLKLYDSTQLAMATQTHPVMDGTTTHSTYCIHK